MKRIVLIEDNEADARLMEEALITSGLICAVMRFRDGSDAIRALMEEGAHVPDVILLDLNMPRSDGLDVLRTIWNTRRLTYAQVGILTGSEARSPSFEPVFWAPRAMSANACPTTTMCRASEGRSLKWNSRPPASTLPRLAKL